MNDKLGREIVVGDTLAYYRPDYRSPHHPSGSLRLAKVNAVAAFDIQVTSFECKKPETWVVSTTAEDYVICDRARLL